MLGIIILAAFTWGVYRIVLSFLAPDETRSLWQGWKDYRRESREWHESQKGQHHE